MSVQKSANLSNKELVNLILYGLKENNIDIEKIDSSLIETIIADYIMFCDVFKRNYVKGELDTFKRASCLLVAINRNRLSKDKRVNASIALDTAYKMCENPYFNIGEEYNIPKKLEEVNFKEVFKDDMYVYQTSKNTLIDSLVYEDGSPMSYFGNLELFYQVALEKKHQQVKPVISDDCEEDDVNLFIDGNNDGMSFFKTLKKRRGIFKFLRKK